MKPPASPDPQTQYLDSLVLQLTGWDRPAERLRHALANNEFMLFQQRIWPLQPDGTGGGRRVIAEILVRLRQEEENLAHPGAFLPVLEHHGMMPQLDRWVIERALEWLWTSESGGGRRTPLRFSINVAPETLIDPGFPAHVVRLCEQYRQRPGVLAFEIHERDITGRGEALTRAAAAVSALGCRIALGGFGQQSVTFKALQALRSHYAKLDGSLARTITHDRVAAAKVQALARVCRTLGVRTVAELVEDREALVMLKNAGVDYAQGFGLSRPAPIGELLTGIES